MDVVQAKADVELCCPALPLNSSWHIQTCESQKPALLCPAWAALQNCEAQAKADAELCCPPSQLAQTYWNVWITENCIALPSMGCVACVSLCARPNCSGSQNRGHVPNS